MSIGRGGSGGGGGGGSSDIGIPIGPSIGSSSQPPNFGLWYIAVRRLMCIDDEAKPEICYYV